MRRRAPIAACGSDALVGAPLPVTPANVILAGDGRLHVPCPDNGASTAVVVVGANPSTATAHPANHREMRERALLDAAVSSNDPEVRRLAAQANGRLGRTVITAMPTSEPVAVRREMAYALGSSSVAADGRPPGRAVAAGRTGRHRGAGTPRVAGSPSIPRRAGARSRRARARGGDGCEWRPPARRRQGPRDIDSSGPAPRDSRRRRARV